MRPLSFADRSQRRNLTDRGRDHARAIGEAIRALAIPIGPVLAAVSTGGRRVDVLRVRALRGSCPTGQKEPTMDQLIGSLIMLLLSLGGGTSKVVTIEISVPVASAPAGASVQVP